jgi:peroxiredoxin Q/BCP
VLAVGDPVPAIDTVDAEGRPIRSTELRGRSFLLFFYPKAGSWGCTREALGFAGRHPEFVSRGIEVFGISVDPPNAQQSFGTKCKLPFPLIPDGAGEIARRFGVLGAFGFARRVTFLVGEDGRIRYVTDSVLPGAHVEGVLAFLDRSDPPPASPPSP